MKTPEGWMIVQLPGVSPERRPCCFKVELERHDLQNSIDEAQPAILAAQNAAQVGGLTMIRTLGARNLRPDSQALAERTLAHLPDLVAEDPLCGVLFMPSNAATVR